MPNQPSFQRYQRSVPLSLPDRRWPDRAATAAPRWLSTDLRDGNQALAVPMSPARKLAMFELLVRLGYKEIEVGFPSAGQDEFDFVRALVERDLIPDDVRVSVLTPARDELIQRSVEALAGARAATLHVYNATAPVFRRTVFGMSRSECRQLAVHGVEQVMARAERTLGDCTVGLQYSPELFNETEPEFALEVCEAVMDVWQPGAGREIILNFPATVERNGPHVFADQIEWLDRNLSHREHVCLSIHPHNDRGTGVASAELAVLAGAQRVEGCLFGGGERAGNVCLVTLALNLLSHGVDPGVDFSDLDAVRETVEHCTGMPVAPRHPYGGELAYTAFSGSHQDAIHKGMRAHEARAAEAGCSPAALDWTVPYLPIDPADVGRDYQAVVRINSQSGKGGVAYVLGAWHGLHLPRPLQLEFARKVQDVTDAEGVELGPERIGRLLREEYQPPADTTKPLQVSRVPVATELFLDTTAVDQETAAALVATLAPWGIQVTGLQTTAPEHEPSRPGAATAVYARCDFDAGLVWGLGIGADLATAAFAAVRAAATRAGEGTTPETPAQFATAQLATAQGGTLPTPEPAR